MSAWRSSSIDTHPLPLRDSESIRRMLGIRAIAPSILLVTSCSITRGAVLGIVYVTPMAGIWRDGNSFTGNSGTSNSPSRAIAMNDTMTENDDFKVWECVCDAVAICVC